MQQTTHAENFVSLWGKVSRAGRVKYAPDGTPIMEFTLAVLQGSSVANKKMGYVEVVLMGEKAEWEKDKLGIGKNILVQGSLWSRQYKDREGKTIREIKILAEKIEDKKKESL